MRKYITHLLIIVSILLYLTVIVLWIADPKEVKINLIFTTIPILLNLILVVMHRDTVLTFLKQKNLYENIIESYNFIAGPILVFFIVGLCNYLAFKNPYFKDFTHYQVNSLSENSVQILSTLTDKIEVFIFSDTVNRDLFMDFFTIYKKYKKDIEVNFYNQKTSPALLAKYNIDKPNTIVVSYKDKQEKITELSQLSFLNALLKLTREKDPVIYYVTNHGEPSLIEGELSISILNSKLKSSYYQLVDVDLQRVDIQDGDLLIIWGPKTPFSDQEIEKIEKYLNEEGKLIVGLDPNLNKDNFENLKKLLIKWGLTANKDIVIDESNSISGAKGLSPFAGKKEVSFTSNIENNIFFPVVSSIEIGENAHPLFVTSNKSWSTTDFGALLKDPFDKSKSKNGPFIVAAIRHEEVTENFDDNSGTKIALFANATFLTDKYINFGDGANLFTAMVSWTVFGDQYTSFQELPDFTFTLNNYHTGIIFYLSVVLIPLISIIIVVVLYLRKRRKVYEK